MIEKILSILNNGNNHLDAIALVPGSNFQYLTGGKFFLMERPLVLIISKTYKPIVILPVLEISNFVKLKFDAEIIEWQDSDGYQAAFEKAINLIGMNFTLGIEGQLMRAFEMQAIQKVSEKIIIKNCHKIISKIRLIKEKDEISNLVKAIEIAEKSLENTLGFVREGLTEIQIKNFLMQQLLENGADAIAFEALVLAGENSALCHGHSRREYVIKKGDSLLFDFGATVNGYHSDITRTFFIGQASEEGKNMYETVLKANTHGRKITKPDLSMNDLDDQVLRILEESPYTEYVVHKTGHGHSRREYIIKKGDSLLFDFGATVNGYHSDITRTFFIGQAVEEDKNMYETVLKANTHGRKITKPDLSMNDLDDQVLRILEESPYKEYVVHKTGHGLGMDVHEDPYVMRGNFEKLEKGMVITIEPGLYRENHLGIRIEDDVLVTEDACKSLTTFNRDLRII